MDLTTKSLLAYFSKWDNWIKIGNFCYDDGAPDGLGGAHISESYREKFLTDLSRDIAKHLSKSRPRKKSKKSRIRAPISFGPSDIL